MKQTIKSVLLILVVYISVPDSVFTSTDSLLMLDLENRLLKVEKAELEKEKAEFIKKTGMSDSLETGFKDWIPFYQAMIWPVFIILVVIIFYRQIKRWIDSGGKIGISFTGITLEGAPVLKNEEIAGNNFLARMYIVHTVVFSKFVAEGKDYEVTVRVYAESEELFERIERVEYHLHKSYRRQIRDSRDAKKAFELKFFAWGQFNLTALVFLKGSEKPSELRRFINF